MKTVRIAVLVSCVGLVGLLVAGCGMNKKSKGAVAHPLNKTQFIAATNAICAPVNKAIAAGVKATLGSGKPTPQQINEFVTRYVVPQTSAEVEKLRAVPAPIGDTNIVKTIWTDLETATAKLKANPQLLAAGGPSPYAQAQQLAKGYGLKVCASTGSG